MNKHILILGLETLLEQLVDSRDYSDDNRAKIGYVMDEMNRLKSPATDEDKARWLSYTLDMEAEEMFVEVELLRCQILVYCILQILCTRIYHCRISLFFVGLP